VSQVAIGVDDASRSWLVCRMTERRATKESSINVRCEPDLVAALDAEAAALSKAAGGARIARSEAARVVLRRALAHHLNVAADATPAPSKGAPSKPASPRKVGARK
jgi:hypothetical protein